MAGVDYTLPVPVTFNPGDLFVTNVIYPLINGQLPVQSTTNVYVGNKMVIIGSCHRQWLYGRNQRLRC